MFLTLLVLKYVKSILVKAVQDANIALADSRLYSRKEMSKATEVITVFSI